MALVAAILALAVPSGGQLQGPHTASFQPRHKGCNTRACDKRVDKKIRARVQRRKRRAVKPFDNKLERMAFCESGQRWHISTGNGFYGGLQFTAQTWWSVGGRGYPHTNTELEQKYRAVRLIRRAGFSPWPVCGFR